MGVANCNGDVSAASTGIDAGVRAAMLQGYKGVLDPKGRSLTTRDPLVARLLRPAARHHRAALARHSHMADSRDPSFFRGRWPANRSFSAIWHLIYR